MRRFLVALASLCVWSPTTFGEARADLSDVQGSWTTYRFSSQAGFAKVDMNFQGTTLEQVTELIAFMPLFAHEGADLRLRSDVGEVRSETDAQGRPLRRLLMTLQKFEMRFNSVRGVDERNRNAYCGITNWVPGEFRDISGRTCREDEDEEPQQMPAAGDAMDLLMAFDGSVMHAALGFEEDEGDEGDDIPVDWDHGLYRRARR
jgi:hypothetical protein